MPLWGMICKPSQNRNLQHSPRFEGLDCRIVDLDCERSCSRHHRLIPLTPISRNVLWGQGATGLRGMSNSIERHSIPHGHMYRFQPGRTNVWMHRFTRGPRMHTGMYAMTLPYVYPHSHPNIYLQPYVRLHVRLNGTTVCAHAPKTVRKPKPRYPCPYPRPAFPPCLRPSSPVVLGIGRAR